MTEKSGTYVEVQCMGCGKKDKIYEGDVEPGDHPMRECGMPYIPVRARIHE